MIGYLNGKIQKKLLKSIILMSGSVGYVVHITTPLLEKLQEDDELELFIHTKVREDDISLFGFEEFAELEFFKLLLGVNGIGPKLGLEIISQNSQKTKLALLQNDIDFLSKIPGIGKKTAERLIVELKSKIMIEDLGTMTDTSKAESKNLDAMEALEGLGYQRFQIIKVLKKLPEKITLTEEIVTYFLRNV